MRPAIQPGIRVVRGPNWIWQNQGMRKFRKYFIETFKLKIKYIPFLLPRY